MSTLYVVGTPIGNLEDMTPRAVRTLREVTLIAAEDTRQTRKLLTHFAISTPLVSYHAHNEQAQASRLVGRLENGDIALVTDAGMPAVSDPGAVVVAAALAAGHTVVPVPGASSLTAAVAASGLVTGPFVMLGFLSRQASERRTQLARAAATGWPCVLFESPQRVATTLDDLAATWGDRPAVLARELTKLHEEVRAGTLTELARYAADGIRGEVVLVIGAAPAPGGAAGADYDSDDVVMLLQSLRRSGVSASAAAREAATVTGRPRSELYALARAAGEPVSPAGTRASGDVPESTGAAPGPGERPRGTTDPD